MYIVSHYSDIHLECHTMSRQQQHYLRSAQPVVILKLLVTQESIFLNSPESGQVIKEDYISSFHTTVTVVDHLFPIAML